MESDIRENRHFIDSHQPCLRLFLRHLPPANDQSDTLRVVLYVHGGTFPSALSIAHRFYGWSWADWLTAAGFHVWGLDFLGFGASDRYPEMSTTPTGTPLGRVPDAAAQIERAVRFIGRTHGIPAVSIIAHSWGTLAAGLFATQHRALVRRMVFFAPITKRRSGVAPAQLPSWRLVTVQAQYDRFVEDVPAGQSAVLDPDDFADWAIRYLGSDVRSDTRNPPSVAMPSGPVADIQDAWHGDFAYDPAMVTVPVAIVRGEWDGLCTDTDARWLWDALTSAPERRDVKVSHATHLMHLEQGRHALYRETLAFLDMT